MMPDFNTLFPNFTNRCVELQQILMPVAYLLLVGGMISSTVTGHRSGAAYIRTFGRTIVFIVLLTFLVSWGNEICTIVDSTVKNVLRVDPSKVYDDYQQALEMQKTAAGERSWWEKVFQWQSSVLEAIITGIFFVFGWIAGALMWWAYLLQKVILFLGYGLAPIFIGFLAFQSLHEVGKRYFLNLVGVMMWPLGWGVAGLVTQSMIDFMTDRSFLRVWPIVGGSDLYSLQNLMGVAFLAIWLIFSIIAAPVIIQKAIATGSMAASHLLSGAFAAGRAATAAGATTLANIGSGVTTVGGAITAGVTGAATAIEALGAASLNGGRGGGSLIGSLSEMQGPVSRRNKSAPTSFPPDDPTGDKSVANLIRATRNPYSERS
jgi:hypothetical protein